MRAMIFAAGKGTRLRPLTNDIPKALVKIDNIALIEHIIKKLIAFNVTDIIVNVHYLANQIIEFLNNNNNFGIRIEISDESDKLLDTGGGLKEASWFLKGTEPFIVYNTDVMSNINLESMLDYHNKKNKLATVAVRERESSRYFLFNTEMDLCGWSNSKTGETKISKKATQYKPLAFSGIHIVDPAIFKHMKKTGTYSIIETYLELAKNKLICGYEHSSDYWFDIGNILNLQTAEKYLKLNKNT